MKSETPPHRPRNLAGQVLLQTILVAILVGAINYLGFQYYERWDFSRSQEFRLAWQTQQILRSLRQEVKITVYSSPTEMSYQSLIFRDINSLLREFIFSGKPKIKVEYVDPTRNLQRAQEVQAQHGFNPNENLMIIEYDGRTKLLPIGDFADFDLTPLAGGQPPQVIAFRGEQVLASALLGLLDPAIRTVYFLQGHGEPSLEQNSPLALFIDYTRRQNVQVEPLNLSLLTAIPENTAAIFIIGSRYDLSPSEYHLLLDYWKKDGRLVILLDPDASKRVPNLHALIQAAGIQAQDTRVLRIIPLKIAIGIVRNVVAQFIASSEIVSRMQGVNAHFPDPAQSLSALNPAPEGTVVRPLIQADEPYWGETEYITNENKGVAYQDGIDVGYPVYMAFSADRGGIKDDRVEIQAAKMIVVGSSKFIFDEYIAGSTGTVANLDFMMSSLNWMLDRNKITGIVSKIPSEFKLALTQEQLSQIALYTMVIMPLAAAFLGFFVWWRRRV